MNNFSFIVIVKFQKTEKSAVYNITFSHMSLVTDCPLNKILFLILRDSYSLKKFRSTQQLRYKKLNLMYRATGN